MMIKESPRIATQNILKKYKAKPQKKFGQNFLENRKSVSRFAEAVDINKDDVIL